MAPEAESSGTGELVLDKAVRFDVPAATLFELFVSEESASQWIGGKVELDAVAGGEVRVAVDGWPVVTGRVEAICEPESLTVSWHADDWPGPLRTAVTISPDGDGARLVLRETGYDGDEDLLRRRDWLWSHWLVRLVATGGQFCARS